MRYLFIDNIRGFETTYIPIKDVNFLVGENSTGKTSILSIINLLSSDKFWQEQDFNTNEVSLGDFFDIVSINSSNKRSFKIGFVDTEISSFKMFMMVFVKSKSGLPIIGRYSYIRGNNEIKTAYIQNQIYYKVNTLIDEDFTDENILRRFKFWASEDIKKEEVYKAAEYRNLERKIRFWRRQSLIYMDSLIGLEIDIEKDASVYEEHEDESVKIEEGGTRSIIFESGFTWIAALRSRPERTYTYDNYKLGIFTPEGKYIPHKIRKILLQKDGSETKEKFLLLLHDFGKNSGLFDKVRTRNYGRGQTSPFELHVIIDKKDLRIGNVGYGVSQSLPIIVNPILGKVDSWFAMQQPEVHLHPRAQAALGGLLFNLTHTDKKHFLIETHSDYLIDRFRLKLRKTEDIIESHVLFFERTKEGNIVHSIEIDQNGEYSEEQPTAFREFFLKEQLEILGL